MSEVFTWSKNLPGGLNLETCSVQFESRGFSTLASLRYLRPRDIDAFFPSPEKLLLAQKSTFESEIKALVDPENKRTPLRPMGLSSRFNSTTAENSHCYGTSSGQVQLTSNILSMTPHAHHTAGPSMIVKGQENKPLDKKVNEMNENLLVLEVQITSASGELKN